MEVTPRQANIGPKPSWCFKNYLQQVKISALFCVIGYPIGCAIFTWHFATLGQHPFSRDVRVIRIAMLSIAIYFGFYTIPFTILLIGAIRKIKWMIKINIIFLALAILFWIGFMIGFFGFGIHFDIGPLIGCILAGLFGIAIAFGAMRDIYRALQEIDREKEQSYTLQTNHNAYELQDYGWKSSNQI